jgi:hypothetical protein
VVTLAQGVPGHQGECLQVEGMDLAKKQGTACMQMSPDSCVPSTAQVLARPSSSFSLVYPADAIQRGSSEAM